MESAVNPPDPNAQFRTRDNHLNAARVLMPDADPDTQGIAAFILSKGIGTIEELGDYISRARAIYR